MLLTFIVGGPLGTDSVLIKFVKGFDICGVFEFFSMKIKARLFFLLEGARLSGPWGPLGPTHLGTNSWGPSGPEALTT